MRLIFVLLNVFISPDSITLQSEEPVKPFKTVFEPTPILRGEDAQRLLDSVYNFKRDPKKARFLKECVELARAIKLE